MSGKATSAGALSRLDEAWTAAVMDSEWQYKPLYLSGEDYPPASTKYIRMTHEEREALTGYVSPGDPPGYLKDIEEEEHDEGRTQVGTQEQPAVPQGAAGAGGEYPQEEA